MNTRVLAQIICGEVKLIIKHFCLSIVGKNGGVEVVSLVIRNLGTGWA
jgi:hypothetical protein